MTRLLGVLVTCVLFGCGGKAASDADTEAMDGGGSTTDGGSTTATTAPPATTSPYEPTDPSVPAAGDGTLEGGSFEGRLGSGWDMCGSFHPGLDAWSPGVASDGEQFLRFDSSLPCENCSERTSDLQVMLWFEEVLPAGETKHLYFDVANFGATPPSGTLVFGAAPVPTSDPCLSSTTLASVPLAELDVSANWATRCVSFITAEPFVDFGLYVSDGAFNIGVDTLRFGPPCHD